jgi:hypothetical protein
MKTELLVVLILALGCPMFAQQSGTVKLINNLGKGMTVRYVIDGRKVKVHRDHYIALALPSGRHTIAAMVVGKSKEMNFNVEEGSVQVFQIARHGPWGYAPELISNEAAAFQLSNLQEQH